MRVASAGDHDRVRAAIDQWWGGRSLGSLLQPLFLDNFSSSSLIVERDGELLAFLVGFLSGDDPRVAYVHFVGVAPSERGGGIGRALYDEFAGRMAPLGVRRLRCVTSVVNDSSVRFHQAIGFDVVGRRPDVGVDGGEYLELERAVPPFVGAQGGEVRWPPADALTGAFVELHPTVPGDAPALFTALDHAEVWQHQTTPRPASVSEMREVVDAYVETMYPWTVRLRRPVGEQDAGDVVGWTSYLDVSQRDARLEIGATSYAPSVWGGVVNPETKLLLLGHAFDDLRFSRVQLKTDIVNMRSQDAIDRLGAVREGVLRRYQRRRDGSLRHTVLYSITSGQWPDVRAGLERRLTTAGGR